MANVSTNNAANPARSETQQRIITTARTLFGEHGVSGTSMQMIADSLGVTKAAIFHQFKSKDGLIRAIAEDPVRRILAVVEAAEAEKSSARAKRVLLRQMVDLAIENRAIVSRLSNDPVLDNFVAGNAGFRALMDRLQRVLIGDNPTPRERVRAAGTLATIYHTAVHELVDGIDDSTLRFHLLELVEQMLDESAPT